MNIILYVRCLIQIRIEPDWNVKANKASFALTAFFIRIEPDWNVKLEFPEIFRKVFALE